MDDLLVKKQSIEKEKIHTNQRIITKDEEAYFQFPAKN